MKQYIDIVKHVLENGKEKRPVRRNSDGTWNPVDGGVMTLACPNVHFSHDMADGFPLLTTKKMAFKTMCVELEGFIKGITDKRWYQDRGCKIWNEWANPKSAKNHFDNANKMSGGEPAVYNLENKKIAQRLSNDLGPIYGYQWRKFDEHYGERYNGTPANGVSQGTDQLKNIVETLQNNPMDRRMVCSAWNPNQAHSQALIPCHTQWGCTVIDDTLHLNFIMRSSDCLLGIPFNIASYALLLCLLAHVGKFKRGNLSALFTDCHLYENQLEQAGVQIDRKPKPLPLLWIKEKNGDGGLMRNAEFDIFDWEYKDVILKGYEPHPPLKRVNVVV